MRDWIKKIFGLYDIDDLVIGGHCGCCGKWIPDQIFDKWWAWGLCQHCIDPAYQADTHDRKIEVIMTPEEIIKQCDEQIAIGYGPASISLIMPGKWGKTNKRRLCPGGPMGEIVNDNFDGRGITVLFDALEVKKFLSNKSP